METEERLTQTQRQTAEALERALARLEEIESRAAEAEARADRAERLAALKAEETERTARLREILDRIAAAEQRASSAEERARAAVEKFSEPLSEAAAARAGRAAEPPDLGGADLGPEQAIPVDAPAGPVSINAATYEELRALGLSVTQTGRVLARRERSGPFSSVDELDQIPGFDADFLDELKARLIT